MTDHTDHSPIAISNPRWTTTAEADFINSLCPVSLPHFPTFDELQGRSHSGEPYCDNEMLSEAFKQAFKPVREFWMVRCLHSYRELTQSEGLVWSAISLKTIRYGKLLEKIPRRLFVHGELDRDDPTRWRYNATSVQGLPSTGIKDRNLTKPLKGLRDKGWITAFESTPHPQFGSSTVYCPLPLRTSVELLLRGVSEQLPYTERGRRLIDVLQTISSGCDEALRAIELRRR
jgi:hypothetical protein